MLWSVRHETLYRYNVPVVFGPHVLRLNPRSETVRIIAHDLSVEPSPSHRFNTSDEFGNCCTHLNFDRNLAARSLQIVSQFEVDTIESVRLDQLELPKLPWPIRAADKWVLYRNVRDPVHELEQLAQELSAKADYAPIAFVESLCQWLHGRIHGQFRLDGIAQRPVETLQSSRGACRDITVLFLELCRYVGLAARFVSGYQGIADTADGSRHLHAWAEVFLPGTGWQGWDPMYGLRVNGGHIALCAAPEQAGTMPIEGGLYFDGSELTSTLDYVIQVEKPSH